MQGSGCNYFPLQGSGCGQFPNSFAYFFQSGRDLQSYQTQAKQLFRKLNAQSPDRCTLEAGVMTFQ